MENAGCKMDRDDEWMDDKLIETGLSLSRVLQDALKERFTW